MKDEAHLCDILSADDITTEVISILLSDARGEYVRVGSLTLQPFVGGVLSEVVNVTLCYVGDSEDFDRVQRCVSHGAVKSDGVGRDPTSSSDTLAIDRNCRRPQRRLLPRGIVAKLNRKDHPQDRMFRVEGAFYSRYATWLQLDGTGGGSSGPTLPFRIPTAVSCSSSCILLERIDHTLRYCLAEGCPVGMTDGMVSNLAAMHAHCWLGAPAAAERFRDLSGSPGVGMSLCGLERERLFEVRWEEYVDGCVSECGLSSGEIAALRSVCAELLTGRRLREVHDLVASYRPTLIHGDFHAANVLYPMVDDSVLAHLTGPPQVEPLDQRPWLLDWATCGAGNPLFDLTFFLIVSATQAMDDPRETERLLRLYHSKLTGGESGRAAEISHDLPYNRCLDIYRGCVLNEFLILVAYNRLSGEFIRATENSSLRKERLAHFCNVNRHCIRALLSPLMNIHHYSLPPKKSKSELAADQAALDKESRLLGM